MLDAGLFRDTSLMQDPAFAAALRLCGQKPVTLPGGLMVLHRRVLGVPLAMLPRAAPPADLAEQLASVGLHRLPLILSPDRVCTLPSAIKIRGPQTFAVLTLDDDSVTARAALHPKWRNQLCRAEKAELQIDHRAMASDPHHPLLRAEAAQARQRGYANWPSALTAAFAAAAPDQTRLFVAKKSGVVVAQMLFLCHGNRATYHIGHISPSGKTCCAHNLLLWQTSRWLADQGYVSLDLGRVDPRNAGLNRFKLRTGADAVQTGGTWLRWHPLARARRP